MGNVPIEVCHVALRYPWIVEYKLEGEYSRPKHTKSQVSEHDAYPGPCDV